jgi:Flp pilus assembly protein TadG
MNPSFPRVVRRIPRARTGISLIYVAITLLLLAGFVVLAIDVGWLQNAKMQLHTAADASARAGVSQVPYAPFDGANGRLEAIRIASNNNCLGDPVNISSYSAQDIDFGFWNTVTRTYTVIVNNPVDLSGANACRVNAHRLSSRGTAVPLLFGSILGFNTSDVSAQAIAMISYLPARGFGLIGLDGINMNGNALATDSYLPGLGAYGSQVPRKNGAIASDGNIDLGNRDIWGDVRPGMPDPNTGLPGTISQKPQSTITGYTAPLDQRLHDLYPPLTVPSGLTNQGNFTSGTKALVGSSDPKNPTDFYFTNFDLGGNTTVTVTGYVRLWVNGNLTVGGNTTVNGSVPDPAQLTINVVGSNSSISADFHGTPQIFMHLYAPTANFQIKGTADFYGWVVAKTLYFNGNAAVHYDESQSFTSPPSRIILVK